MMFEEVLNVDDKRPKVQESSSICKDSYSNGTGPEEEEKKSVPPPPASQHQGVLIGLSPTSNFDIL